MRATITLMLYNSHMKAKSKTKRSAESLSIPAKIVTYGLILLLAELILLGILSFTSRGDRSQFTQSFLAINITGVASVATYCLLARSRFKAKAIPVTIAVSVVGAVVSAITALFVYPEVEHTQLAKHGKTVNASVLSAEPLRYSPRKYRHNQSASSIHSSERILVSVRLEDGRTTQFSITTRDKYLPKFSYSAIYKDMQASGKLKVRYLENHSWAARPEYEFTGGAPTVLNLD